MDSLIVALISIVASVIATAWVSNYYFHRSTRKALTPFIQFFTSVFRGVDPSVRDSLKIAYKGTPITDLVEVQFLIANTGERPIRDLISPLTLKVPETVAILDASILHVHPEGRDVSIDVKDSDVIFSFSLLNSKEFFITKLLLEGTLRPSDFRFTISLDDLPPSLKPQPLSASLIETEKKRGFEPAILAVGLCCVIVGASFANIIYAQWLTIFHVGSADVIETLKANVLTLISLVIAGFPTFLLLIFGPMLIIGAFTDFSFPRRTRFRIPSDYLRDHPFFEPEMGHPSGHVQTESSLPGRRSARSVPGSAGDPGS